MCKTLMSDAGWQSVETRKEKKPSIYQTVLASGHLATNTRVNKKFLPRLLIRNNIQQFVRAANPNLGWKLKMTGIPSRTAYTIINGEKEP